MKSKACVVAVAAVISSCSPVANPLVGGAGGLRVDASEADGDELDGSSADHREAGDVAVEVPPLSQVCGNGIREGDEYCDDFQNHTPGFGCKDNCAAVEPPQCGDGVVSPPEVCDGPVVYCDACTKIVGSCGDGVKQTPVEDCDTKGESATCDADCTRVECGDRVVNRAAKEVCDDGLNDGQLGSCTIDCLDYVAKAADAQFASCMELRTSVMPAGQALRSGYYWLHAKDGTAYVAYCDMVSEGGGWTLVMRAIDWNFDYYDPLWSNTTLENPTSFDFETQNTRSKYRAYLEVPFTELRTSEPADHKTGYVAAVAEASALALFGANGGEGLGVTILPSGPNLFEEYFNSRADPDDRQWGCDQFIHIGLNLHALLDVKDLSSTSLGAGSGTHCDWDGGARFGQRVNTCHYSASGRECSGNHGGQGWGNFNNIKVPLRAKPISQLLWVR